MASSINIPAYSDALVVLGTAGIVVPLVHRLGISPVLGYLGAGALLGPLGLGSFIDQLPLLYWVTVVDAKNVAGIADLGVVFLLFLIGLELSYERLMAMRRLVFGLGGLQVVLSTVRSGRHHRRCRHKPPRRHHARRVSGPVVDRDRARSAVEPGPAADQRRTGEFSRSCWRRISRSFRS